MININLLPKDLRRAGGTDYWKLGAAAVAVVGLGTMLGLQLSVAGTLRGLERDIAQNKSERDLLAPQVQEQKDLLARKTQLEAVTAVATTLKAGQTSWSGDLARFVRHLPTGPKPVVALNSLTMRVVDAAGQQTAKQNGLYDGKAVTKEVQLGGKARSSAGLVQFVNTFENAPDFGVQFQNMQRDEQTGQYTFSATVGMMAAPSAEVPGTPPAQAAPTGSGTGTGAQSNATPATTATTVAATAGGSR